MARPVGHMFYIVLYREKHEKIFLSETKRPRALIFGMKHHIVNIYQVCSNYIPGTKNGHTLVVGFHRIFLSEIIWPRALIFSM